MSKPFFIFIVISAFVVVAAVAWFANHQSQLNTNTETTTTTVTDNTGTNEVKNSSTTLNSNVNVNSTAKGFTVLQTAKTVVNGEITTYTFPENNYMNAMPASMQTVTVAETAVQQREPITIGNVTGERLIVSSAKDGSDQTVIQVVHNETLYDFRGSADFLDHLTEYIQFN